MAMESIVKYSKDDIDLKEVIGSGGFSTVYKGRLKRTEEKDCPNEYAVKVTKFVDEKEQVLTEITNMKKLLHKNVVRILGIAEDEETAAWIIMEYMENGTAISYAMRNRMSKARLSQFLRDVALGMEYIHKNLIVHCDLHGDNCFVGNDLTVKVGDLGQSYKLKDDEEEASMMKGIGKTGRPDVEIISPVGGSRWKAPEYFQGPEFAPIKTRPGDVWAYGILVYELTIRGAQLPYSSSMDDADVAEEIVAGKTPLDFHDKVHRIPSRIVKLLLECWNFSLEARPKFSEVLKRLDIME